MRYTSPKNRIARRFGVNVFHRGRNPMAHKPHPPGMHGAKRRKDSDFGVQLKEKQKLKAAFGMISEKQIHRYFVTASRRHGNTPELFLQLLETRLDVVVFRLRFAPTLFAAQQLVSHGHIEVDGRRVNIRSFQVQPGMEIKVREKSRKIKSILNSVQATSRTVPDYLELREDMMSGKLLQLPSMDAIPLSVEANVPMICDFLSYAG